MDLQQTNLGSHTHPAFQILFWNGTGNLDNTNILEEYASSQCRSFGIKENGLEVNADKNKCMVTYRDQNAGRSHSMKIDNSSFERVEEFKYLGTNQN
jgi:hypothetical protein